jgi:hypothetical protein
MVFSNCVFHTSHVFEFIFHNSYVRLELADCIKTFCMSTYSEY